VAVKPRLRAFAFALWAAGCGDSPELTLQIRVPADDQGLFRAVTTLNLTARRDGIVLAQSSFAATVESVSLAGVSHGPRTVIALEGVDRSNQVIARGQTCPLDFDGPNTTAPLYFAPTNFFAPTPGMPATIRDGAVGSPLADGTVLIAGGADPSATVLASAERFFPAAASFTSEPGSLGRARARAEAVLLPDVGLLVVGGVDGMGVPIAEAELYLEAQARFLALADPRLDGRVGHRVILLSDGRALVTGGMSETGTVLPTTLFITVLDDGTYQVSQGPALMEARTDHAATVAVGVPIVFGGYGASGEPLDSIEAINLAPPSGQVIAHMRSPRAEATASVLSDGSILLVGGVGATHAPLADAELFNPITRSTTFYPLAVARRGHSATLLPDGRVMIAGGVDATGAPIREVELFAAGVGFVSERSLDNPRAGHLAVPLCDETVLFVGGGDGAELYSGAAN
jgi:hypothetical protein